MANTYTLLASVTVGSGGATSIDFNSIPQTTYTDILVKLCVRTDNTNGTPNLRINGSTTSYSGIYLAGNGSSMASGSSNTTYLDLLGLEGPTQTSNTFTNTEFYIPGYLNATYKSVLIDSVSENNASLVDTALISGLWSNTSAISSLSIRPTGATNFVQYSTAYLYGIKTS